jgi:hypothetical protein
MRCFGFFAIFQELLDFREAHFSAFLTTMMLRLLTVAVVALTSSTTTSAFAPSTHAVSSSTELHAADRRAFLGASIAAAAALVANAPPSFAAQEKVLVLGGTGLVGSRIVSKLKSMGIEVVSTSTNGRDGTVALDFSSPSTNVAKEIEKLAQGCTAVISAVGVIGSTNLDATVNAASGLAAGGAKQAGVSRFVYISVAPEVKQLAKGIDFLDDYMTGKQFSEDSIATYFGANGLVVAPTFIYGGNAFGLTPPRVTSQYGQLIEGLLSSGPVRAITNIAPEGIIKIGLEPPVSAEAVASAAIAGALGKAGSSALDTYDKIEAAAKTV